MKLSTTSSSSSSAEDLARDRIDSYLGLWDKRTPLVCAPEHVIAHFADPSKPDTPAYVEAVTRLVPRMLRDARRGYELRASRYWVARIGLPGMATFSYSLHSSEEEAEEAVTDYRSRAETARELETARVSIVCNASSVLWDTWTDGTLIYRDLL